MQICILDYIRFSDSAIFGLHDEAGVDKLKIENTSKKHFFFFLLGPISNLHWTHIIVNDNENDNTNHTGTAD